jgi:hypothetical protein
VHCILLLFSVSLIYPPRITLYFYFRLTLEIILSTHLDQNQSSNECRVCLVASTFLRSRMISTTSILHIGVTTSKVDFKRKFDNRCE